MSHFLAGAARPLLADGTDHYDQEWRVGRRLTWA